MSSQTPEAATTDASRKRHWRETKQCYDSETDEEIPAPKIKRPRSCTALHERLLRDDDDREEDPLSPPVTPGSSTKSYIAYGGKEYILDDPPRGEKKSEERETPRQLFLRIDELLEQGNGLIARLGEAMVELRTAWGDGVHLDCTTCTRLAFWEEYQNQLSKTFGAVRHCNEHSIAEWVKRENTGALLAQTGPETVTAKQTTPEDQS